jgi:hypothetical protein
MAVCVCVCVSFNVVPHLGSRFSNSQSVLFGDVLSPLLVPMRCYKLITLLGISTGRTESQFARQYTFRPFVYHVREKRQLQNTRRQVNAPSILISAKFYFFSILKLLNFLLPQDGHVNDLSITYSLDNDSYILDLRLNRSVDSEQTTLHLKLVWNAILFICSCVFHRLQRFAPRWLLWKVPREWWASY